METLLLIATLLPLVQSAIQMAEKLFKGKMKGKAKKKAVMDNVMKAWIGAKATGLIKGEVAAIPDAQVEVLASMMVDTGVGIFNAAGVFAKNE